ncbi:glucagon-1-like [Bombina bombina]|uniref:glucagon-1-like n=1 Tax=Bombina bombina TaxID=8345 RepID=UPI00235B0F47|nr:glucagon-1-like [Bombina bombina]
MNHLVLICLAGALILMVAPNSLQMLIADCSDETSWQEYHSQSFTANIKRHSEGTFSSDLTRYMDKIKARDFVQWLMSKKRLAP